MCLLLGWWNETTIVYDLPTPCLLWLNPEKHFPLAYMKSKYFNHLHENILPSSTSSPMDITLLFSIKFPRLRHMDSDGWNIGKRNFQAVDLNVHCFQLLMSLLILLGMDSLPWINKWIKRKARKCSLTEKTNGSGMPCERDQVVNCNLASVSMLLTPLQWFHVGLCAWENGQPALSLYDGFLVCLWNGESVRSLASSIASRESRSEKHLLTIRLPSEMSWPRHENLHLNAKQHERTFAQTLNKFHTKQFALESHKIFGGGKVLRLRPTEKLNPSFFGDGSVRRCSLGQRPKWDSKLSGRKSIKIVETTGEQVENLNLFPNKKRRAFSSVR